VLVCYDFHYGIFDEKEDLMFATKLGLFSIGTIVVPILIMLEKPINLIASIGLKLVEQVYNMLNLYMYYLFRLIHLLNQYLHYLFK
jgi:hypothetical protein